MLERFAGSRAPRTWAGRRSDAGRASGVHARTRRMGSLQVRTYPVRRGLRPVLTRARPRRTDPGSSARAAHPKVLPPLRIKHGRRECKGVPRPDAANQRMAVGRVNDGERRAVVVLEHVKNIGQGA